MSGETLTGWMRNKHTSFIVNNDQTVTYVTPEQLAELTGEVQG